MRLLCIVIRGQTAAWKWEAGCNDTVSKPCILTTPSWDEVMTLCLLEITSSPKAEILLLSTA